MEKILERVTGLKGTGIAITGATGFIGRYLVSRLLQEGAQLEIITRNQARLPSEWQKQSMVVEKGIAEGALKLPAGTKIVFHCAGETREPRQFYKTNVEGTRNVLDACLDSGVKKFVHLSSVGVMGIEKPGTFDETSPCFPRNDYEKSKLEAERLVLEAGRKKGMLVAVLRPSIVYGPGKLPERDSFLSLISAIKKGYFCYIGSDENIYNIVYVGDVVEALLFLAVAPSSGENGVFIINDAISWRDFVHHAQPALNLKNKVGTLPKTSALLFALGCELGRGLGAKLPFSITRFKALTCKTKFSSEKIKKELGFKFLYGNDQGLKETINYYRQNNLL